jgi:hypothetical protein
LERLAAETSGTVNPVRLSIRQRSTTMTLFITPPDDGWSLYSLSHNSSIKNVSEEPGHTVAAGE